MRIIQSFAMFPEGSPYARNTDKIYLGFYSFLLSFLLLKKYYGHVTMYCNQRAYDAFIRYIPYNEIIIIENDTIDFKLWSFYKIKIIGLQTEDFIHVDSDVLIFDDLFRDFSKADILIQDILKPNNYGLSKFVEANRYFLEYNELADSRTYDGRCFSCGTFGMKAQLVPEYIRIAKLLTEAYQNNWLYECEPIGMLLEEMSLYLYSVKYKLRVCEIIPYAEVLSIGNIKAGDNHKYTHLWFDTKFQNKYIIKIKNKLVSLFPEIANIISVYETEVLNPKGL